MENTPEIEKRHRLGRANIIIGLVLFGAPIVFLKSIPANEGLGLVIFVPILFLLIIGGFFLTVRGLFLYFQSPDAKKVPSWITYVVLLVILVIGILFINGKFGFFDALKFSRENRTGTTSAQNKNSQIPQATTTQTASQVTPVSTVVSGNVVTIKDWGISFVKPADFQVVNASHWSISRDVPTANRVFLCNVDCGDQITIDYIQGGTITTTDAKFGDTTIFFDQATQQWKHTAMPSDKEPGAISPEGPAWVVMSADSGLPVFGSTGRWKTYIVPLSPTQILRFNITGGGITQPLTDLVKTLRKI